MSEPGSQCNFRKIASEFFLTGMAQKEFLHHYQGTKLSMLIAHFSYPRPPPYGDWGCNQLH
jgi:hypothetical protein